MAGNSLIRMTARMMALSVIGCMSEPTHNLHQEACSEPSHKSLRLHAEQWSCSLARRYLIGTCWMCHLSIDGHTKMELGRLRNGVLQISWSSSLLEHVSLLFQGPSCCASCQVIWNVCRREQSSCKGPCLEMPLNLRLRLCVKRSAVHAQSCPGVLHPSLLLLVQAPENAIELVRQISSEISPCSTDPSAHHLPRLSNFVEARQDAIELVCKLS